MLANREYKPEPLPLTERVPWLIYLVLAASSIALGFVLFSLARTATRFSHNRLATKRHKSTKENIRKRLPIIRQYPLFVFVLFVPFCG